MSTFALERPPGLARAVAARLSDAILSGHFKPGERLLETAIAQSLDVSRASLREALRTLEAEGLVEIRQSRGAHVVNPSVEEIEQMTLFRAILEGTAAHLVASRRDPASLKRLADIIERQKAVIANSADNNDFLRVHWEFHHAICEESGNGYIVRAMQSASNAIRIYHRIRNVVGPPTIRNNIIFLDAMTRLTPFEAEGILRSQIIKAAYEMLGKPIPATISSYVTCYIDDEFTVRWIGKAASSRR